MMIMSEKNNIGSEVSPQERTDPLIGKIHPLEKGIEVVVGEYEHIMV